MRAYLIIIFQVRQQYVTEVPLSEHNNVVKAFPSDRTDQPFGTSILPRGAWRRWSVANAHRSKSSDEDNAIGPVPVADQIVGSPFPAEGFRNLICNPFCGRMRCDAEPYDLSSAVPHDQQSIEQTKRDCRHDEQIYRSDPIRMIAKESLPTLRRRFSPLDHILGHTRLPDFDAELEQLSMDPRRGSPQNVDLLPKHPDLCFQCCSRSHQVDERPENQPAKISHYAVASADSSLLANWIKFTIGTPKAEHEAA